MVLPTIVLLKQLVKPFELHFCTTVLCILLRVIVMHTCYHTPGRSPRIVSRTPVSSERKILPPNMSVLKTFHSIMFFQRRALSFQIAINVI